jgi:ubiquinone/menaquinone biosynthesis C-methylase UbiE
MNQMPDSKSYFNDVAPRWDAMRKDFFSDSVREKAFSVAGVQPGKLAADIGAGSGFITEGLIQKGVRVIAVDQSEAMLAVMQKKFADHPGIQYRPGNAESLPIADDRVDYAFANMYLHHVETPPAAIREMVRILKPEGKLVITDLDTHDFHFLKEEHHDRWPGFERQDIHKWLTEAGLIRANLDCAGEDCCTRSACGGVQAQISIFLAIGVKRPINPVTINL